MIDNKSDKNVSFDSLDFILERRGVEMSLFLHSRDILLHFAISLCLFLGPDTYLDYNSCQTPSHQDSAPLGLGARHNSHGHKQVSVGAGEGEE